jgi:plasmid stabilization system protein ParE
VSVEPAKLDIVVTPEADDDISQAAEWYEEQQRGLADRFLNEVRWLFERLASNPLQFPTDEEGVRQAILRIFPYTAYFRAETSQVVVLALLHQSRHPATWRTRT